MRTRGLAFLLLALAVAAAAAPPPAPPPPPAPLGFMGRDQILIGRVYWRDASGTRPLGRFGMILGGKPGSQAVTLLGDEPSVGDSVVTFTAKREGEREARVEWSLRPGSGARVGAASGRASVTENSVGHVALGRAGEGELFASLETGRASGFNLERLYQHFGVVTERQKLASGGASMAASPAPAGTWPPPQWVAPPAAAAPIPVRGTLTLSCPSGTQFDLATGTAVGNCDVEVDGDRVAGATCDDGAGNSARASCTLDGGKGSCLSTRGAGSCRRR